MRDRSLTSIKAELTAEFDRPAPQLRDCHLQAIEPGGRVWFWVPAHSMLWGYDGKTWLEYVIPDFSHYSLRGALSDARRAQRRALERRGGRGVWFIGYGRLYRFDGRNWTRQKISDTRDTYGMPRQVLLAVTPDGKSAAACDPRGTFWLWRDGKWTPGEPLVPPRSDAAAAPQAAGGAARGHAPRHGAARRRRGNRLITSGPQRYLVVDGRRRTAASETERRERCAEGKAQCRGPGLDRQARFLRSMRSARGRRRSLRSWGPRFARRWRRPWRHRPTWNNGRGSRFCSSASPRLPAGKTLCGFGVLEVGDVQQLWQDTNGRVFVQAAAVVQPRGRSGPGLAVLNADGKTQAVFFNDAAAPGALQPLAPGKAADPGCHDRSAFGVDGAPSTRRTARGSSAAGNRRHRGCGGRAGYRSRGPRVRLHGHDTQSKASSAFFAAARQGNSNSLSASWTRQGIGLFFRLAARLSQLPKGVGLAYASGYCCALVS